MTTLNDSIQRVRERARSVARPIALLLCAGVAWGTLGTACSALPSKPASVTASKTLAGATAAATSGADANRANAAGDIPDTQAFVTYGGPGYSVLVPEGWARTQRGPIVTFTWNANAEAIVDGAAANQTSFLRTQFGATGPIAERRTAIGGSPVTIATFTSHSRPDPVTGKSLPIASESYLFVRGKRRVALVLSAPAGADNVDQWKKLSGSLRWK